MKPDALKVRCGPAHSLEIHALPGETYDLHGITTMKTGSGRFTPGATLSTLFTLKQKLKESQHHLSQWTREE